MFDVELVRSDVSLPTDYFDVIKTPMDFVKIDAKLSASRYADPLRFKVLDVKRQFLRFELCALTGSCW